MKTGKGFEQCYNAQAVVDEGEQLIVATALGSNAADNGYWVELLDELKSNTGMKPKLVLADAGYKGEKNSRNLRIGNSRLRGLGTGKQQGRGGANASGRRGDGTDAQAAEGQTGPQAA